MRGTEETKEGMYITTRDKSTRKMLFFSKKGKKMFLTDAGCEYIASMSAMGCTIDDIADELGVSKQTLYAEHNRANLDESVKIGQGRLKNSLRMAQVKTAVKGNSAMLIFLGKNYLGQSDNPAGEEAQTTALTGLVKAMMEYKDNDETTDADDTPPQ